MLQLLHIIFLMMVTQIGFCRQKAMFLWEIAVDVVLGEAVIGQALNMIIYMPGG